MIAIDAQGFFVHNKFHIAELSFFNNSSDRHYIFKVNLPRLKFIDQKTVSYVSRKIHGISSRQDGLTVEPEQVILEIARGSGDEFVTNNQHLHSLLLSLNISASLVSVSNKDLENAYKTDYSCHIHSFRGRCSKSKVKKLFFYLSSIKWQSQKIDI